MNLEQIGTVHSCFKVKFGTPRQGALASHSRGYVELDKKWEPEKSLKNLEDFSHAWILFWFHDNKNLVYRPVVRPPRLQKRVGVLASRTPLRPNPIGLSLVKIDKVVGSRLYISGIDMIDGTPVIDIKPYIHAYDSVEGSSAGWVDTLEPHALDVQFSEEALQQIEASEHMNLRETITDILSSDIRNRNDRSAKNEGKRLGFYYEDLNVVFQTIGSSVLVTAVDKAES
jgi:tRNA-Thr(GGU) m(6)t(6)A37 methyltransferase TsaA